MKVLRLLIKGDAIQCGENDFYCPCRTIDIKVADNVIDKEHEHSGDLISRQQAIDAVAHITSSMSVCANLDECHGMKRMQRQAVIELANLPSEQQSKDV